MFSTPDPAQALFTAALELLSRRDHSRRELTQKLSPKFPDADFSALFLRLEELNYQSDQRFAEMFARSRVQRGHGPLRIRQDLQQRGIPSSMATSAIDTLDTDWFELAYSVLQRKFASRGAVVSLKREQQMRERARRQRFLAYRGFSADAIGYALDTLEREARCGDGLI
ncbi:recombination regulator RecX [Microbulbifer agarilyticus]|uniref:regulatory protein RecX n=1 Tax=Microbulbifer agarilyticus TaxID=260552 RepID=UPI001C943DA9|nr:regulatory protein RecX [Microbulbifer agarilyticus]MBY6192058.1 recombination regulator RecX [Microbulbifer agarilyticus]